MQDVEGEGIEPIRQQSGPLPIHSLDIFEQSLTGRHTLTEAELLNVIGTKVFTIFSSLLITVNSTNRFYP
jgi:hypothetical protein